MNPAIDWSEYKTTATIDWLRLHITLARRTQFRYIRQELRTLLALPKEDKSIKVEAVCVPNSNDPATVFTFKLHDQHHGNNQARLAHILHGLAIRFPFAAPARIDGIEVSIDLWPKRPNAAPQEVVATALQLSLAAYGDNPRQYDPSTDSTLGLLEHPAPIAGATFYVNHHEPRKGRKATPVAWRVYPKITDDNGMSLPPDQHRARAEVTLQGDALGLYNLTDPLALASYDFTKLADLLHFRPLLPPSQRLKKTILRRKAQKGLQAALKKGADTQTPTPLDEVKHLRLLVGLVNTIQKGLAQEAQCHTASWPYGWVKQDPLHGDERRKHSIHTEPDAELNDRVKAALKTLAKNMGKIAATGKKHAAATR